MRGVPGPNEGVGGDSGCGSRGGEHQRRAARQAGAVNLSTPRASSCCFVRVVVLGLLDGGSTQQALFVF